MEVWTNVMSEKWISQQLEYNKSTIIMELLGQEMNFSIEIHI